MQTAQMHHLGAPISKQKKSEEGVHHKKTARGNKIAPVGEAGGPSTEKKQSVPRAGNRMRVPMGEREREREFLWLG